MGKETEFLVSDGSTDVKILSSWNLPLVGNIRQKLFDVLEITNSLPFMSRTMCKWTHACIYLCLADLRQVSHQCCICDNFFFKYTLRKLPPAQLSFILTAKNVISLSFSVSYIQL